MLLMRLVQRSDDDRVDLGRLDQAQSVGKDPRGTSMHDHLRAAHIRIADGDEFRARNARAQYLRMGAAHRARANNPNPEVPHLAAPSAADRAACAGPWIDPCATLAARPHCGLDESDP